VSFLRSLVLPLAFILAHLVVGKIVQPQAALLTLFGTSCFYAGFLVLILTLAKPPPLWRYIGLGFALVLISLILAATGYVEMHEIAPEAGVVSAVIVVLSIFGLTTAWGLGPVSARWSRRTSAFVAVGVAAVLGGALGFGQPVFERAAAGGDTEIDGVFRVIHGQPFLEVRTHGLDSLLVLDAASASVKPDQAGRFAGPFAHRAGLTLLRSNGTFGEQGVAKPAAFKPGSETAPVLHGEIVPFQRFFGRGSGADGLPLLVVRDRYGNRQHLFLVVPDVTALDGLYGKAIEIPAGSTIETHHNIKFLIADPTSFVRLGSPL